MLTDRTGGDAGAAADTNPARGLEKLIDLQYQKRGNASLSLLAAKQSPHDPLCLASNLHASVIIARMRLKKLERVMSPNSSF
jgi:hypothetical protein